MLLTVDELKMKMLQLLLYVDGYAIRCLHLHQCIIALRGIIEQSYTQTQMLKIAAKKEKPLPAMCFVEEYTVVYVMFRFCDAGVSK